MSHELQTIKNELTIAQQQNEIIQLKLQLEKTQAEKASRLEDSLFSPALYKHYQLVAETLARSSVIPKSYQGKAEDIFVAMAMGYQLGFPVEQALQDIAVINGRPCLWGDGLLSLCLNHAQCVSIDESPIYQGEIVTGYSCTVVRKGHEPHTQVFTLQDAERAGLIKRSPVWQSYPARMLQMRARSLALRDKFADALRGLRVAEVEQDDALVIDVDVQTPKKTKSQTENVKNIIKGTLEPKNNKENKEEKPGEKETQKKEVKGSGRDDHPCTPEQIAKIKFLMENAEFDEERTKKAFSYYKINALEELTEAQAQLFITQLAK